MKSRLVDSRQRAAGRMKSGVSKLHRNLTAKTVLISGMLFYIPSLLMAQSDTAQTHTVDMATTMRSNGKIYVVVAVLVIILLGLFFYLIRLDRKIGKLERE